MGNICPNILKRKKQTNSESGKYGSLWTDDTLCVTGNINEIEDDDRYSDFNEVCIDSSVPRSARTSSGYQTLTVAETSQGRGQRKDSLCQKSLTEFSRANFDDSLLEDKNLKLLDHVIIHSSDGEYRGTLKWAGIIGVDDDRKYACAGIELEKDWEFGTSGIYERTELFKANSKRGVLIPIHLVTKDTVYRPNAGKIDDILITDFLSAVYNDSILQEHGVNLGDTIYINAPSDTYLATLKWCGYIDEKQCVGVELNEDCQLGTNGHYKSVKLFDSKEKRGAIVPLNYISRDVAQNRSHKFQTEHGGSARQHGRPKVSGRQPVHVIRSVSTQSRDGGQPDLARELMSIRESLETKNEDERILQSDESAKDRTLISRSLRWNNKTKSDDAFTFDIHGNNTEAKLIIISSHNVSSMQVEYDYLISFDPETSVQHLDDFQSIKVDDISLPTIPRIPLATKQIQFPVDQILTEKNVFSLCEYLSFNEVNLIKLPLIVITEKDIDHIENSDTVIQQLITSLILFLHYGYPVEKLNIALPLRIIREASFQKYLEETKLYYEKNCTIGNKKLPFQILIDKELDGKFIIPKDSPHVQKAFNIGCFIDISETFTQEYYRAESTLTESGTEFTTIGLMKLLTVLKHCEIFMVYVRRNDFFKNIYSRFLTILAFVQQNRIKSKFVFMITPGITKLPTGGTSKSDQNQAAGNLYIIRVDGENDGLEVVSNLLNQTNISEDVQAVASSTAELGLNLTADTRPWVTILYDLENRKACRTARRLTNKLTAGNIAVYSRAEKFNHLTDEPDYEVLDDLKYHFQNITDSQILIVLISPSFFQNIDCRLEYTLALIQHAANYPRQRMLTFALSEQIFHNMGAINDVFKKEYIHVMVDRNTNSNVYLNQCAIEYLCDRVLQKDGRLINVNQNWFPTNLEGEADALNIISPRPTQEAHPQRLLVCSDRRNEEKVNGLFSYIRDKLPDWYIDVPTRHNGKATISEEVAKGTNDLIVLFLITEHFINNENNMNTMYEMFLCINNCPLVRVVHLNPVNDDTQIPNFIKRIPSVARKEGESDARFYANVLSWITDQKPNAQSGVLIEPPNCFRLREDMDQLIMNYVIFPHNE